MENDWLTFWRHSWWKSCRWTKNMRLSELFHVLTRVWSGAGRSLRDCLLWKQLNERILHGNQYGRSVRAHRTARLSSAAELRRFSGEGGKSRRPKWAATSIRERLAFASTDSGAPLVGKPSSAPPRRGRRQVPHVCLIGLPQVYMWRVRCAELLLHSLLCLYCVPLGRGGENFVKAFSYFLFKNFPQFLFLLYCQIFIYLFIFFLQGCFSVFTKNCTNCVELINYLYVDTPFFFPHRVLCKQSFKKHFMARCYSS